MSDAPKPQDVIGSLIPPRGSSGERVSLKDALSIARRELSAGRFARAEELYRQILLAFPTNFEAAHNLSSVLREQGHNEEALALAARAIENRPGDPRGFHVRACVLSAMGRHEEAIADFQRAVEAKPDFAEAWRNLGNTCVRQGSLDEARPALERALELEGDVHGPLLDLGNAYWRQGMPQKAEAVLRKLLAVGPENVGALSLLSNVLGGADRLDEALECCRKATRLRPDHPGLHVNLGHLLFQQERLEEALAEFDLALKLKPDDALAHFDRGMVLLDRGDLAEGWKEFRWRWRWTDFCSRHLRLRFDREPWDGEELNGARILIHYEQGIGDVIQFVRYVPMVVQRGGRVVLEVQEPLVRLLRGFPGVEEVVPHGTPPQRPVQTYSAIMDVPSLCGISLENVPSDVPYLAPYPQDVNVWRERLSREGRTKVALVWAGNPVNPVDARRSMDVTFLRPLLGVSGAAFYSLQFGRDGDLQRLGAEAVTDLSPHLKDFADTAAVVSQLDLVIAVDTAVVHLAGAMAKPVWLLLPFRPDWRWMGGGPGSPWYPTLRIFRQTAKGDWAGVIARVAEALARCLAGRE